MTITLMVPELSTVPGMDTARSFQSAVEALGYKVGFHTEVGRRAIRIEATLTKVPRDLVDAGLKFVSYEIVQSSLPETAAIPGTYEGDPSEHDRGIVARVETYIRDGLRCQTIRVTGPDLAAAALYFDNLIAGKRNHDCLLPTAPDLPDGDSRSAGLHLNPDRLCDLHRSLGLLRNTFTSNPIEQEAWRRVAELVNLRDD